MAAKFGEVSEDVKSLVDKVLKETGLDVTIDAQVLNTLSANEIIKVGKLNPMGEKIIRRENVVYIAIYERAFERLSERQQELLVRDALNFVTYDLDKGRLTIGCPKISVSCSGLMKFGEELINAAETAVLAIQQIKEDDKEAKEAAKYLSLKKKT